LNDVETEVCTHIERQFLKTLEGGCTAPIGAIARIMEDDILFKGVLFSLDGKEKVLIEKSVPIQEWKKLGYYSAQEVLQNGGKEIMKVLRNHFKPKA
jgi:hydroxymethylbilane synthase